MGGILDDLVGLHNIGALQPARERLQINPMAATQGLGGILGGGSLPRPYKNVPDNLMGFKKDGEINKTFEETNYPFSQWVHVDLGNGNQFVDSIKGLNQPHAMERAYRNWDTENIRPITPTEAYQLDPKAFSPLDFVGPMGQ